MDTQSTKTIYDFLAKLPLEDFKRVQHVMVQMSRNEIRERQGQPIKEIK